MARNIISGEAGSSWTNEGDKVQYQLIVLWQHSCGLCIQYDHQIGPFWPTPFHRRCLCRQIPILPGSTSRPFVDFREKIHTVSHAQQAAIMGRASLTLVESGVVQWSDVVTTGRIRSLREVVSRQKLTVDQMVAVGVSRAIAQEAFDAVNTGTHTATEQARHRQIAALLAQGYTKPQIADSVASTLASRVSIGTGPSGPSTIPPLPPTHPPAPPIVLPEVDPYDFLGVDKADYVKPEEPKLDVAVAFRPVPPETTTITENAVKFPGLTIRPDQVADYTASSATQFVMTHRTNAESYRNLMRDGIDLDKTSGIIGQGLYVSTQDEKMYGRSKIKVAIDTRNPLIGSSDELFRLFKLWHNKNGGTPNADQMRDLAIAKGYDLIVWDWGPGTADKLDPVQKYWQVIIHPEQCRFVVEE